jgi:hypothetical protein
VIIFGNIDWWQEIFRRQRLFKILKTAKGLIKELVHTVLQGSQLKEWVSANDI